MAGIYVHIPFCKKACHYCNFHFSTSMGLKSEVIDSIVKEIELQNKYLDDESISTIYFGGGTPSLLDIEEVNLILKAIKNNFEVEDRAELSLEANPDDLDTEKIAGLKSVGINRLSIGIQSFNQEDLVWMNRSHNASQSHKILEDCIENELTNLSIDLVFGIPVSSNNQWKENLIQGLAYNINHISCYGLTVEEKTALHHFIKNGTYEAPDETLSAEQFRIASDYLRSQGYLHYEISNYAKPGHISKHNSNYWRQENYLGIGPSAHSYNGNSRQWNISHNKKYGESLKLELLPSTMEILSAKDRFNEYVMTGLRTIWGCNAIQLKTINSDFYEMFRIASKPLIDKSLLIQKDDHIFLSEEAKLIADAIISELFVA